MVWWFLLLPIIGGLCWRQGGTKHNWGGGFLFRCLPFGILAASFTPGYWFLGVVISYGLAVTVAMYLGEAAYGYSKWWYVNSWNEFGKMTLRGLVFTLPAGLITMFDSSLAGLIYSLSGLCFGVSYWIAKHIPSVKYVADSGPEIGEIIFGSIIFTVGGLAWRFL